MNQIPESKSQAIASSQRILQALKQARSKVEALEQQKTEPIAIIGMGCRFPGGVNNPESYWKLLKEGKDVITEIPPDRWDVEHYYDRDPDVPGKMYSRYGGFLDEVDNFDPQFFGISPREAISMDPQQRLLLEVSWEALENTGLATEELQGTQTTVFVGIGSDDYSQWSVNSGDVNAIDTYSGLGNARSIAAGRLAYFLGLQAMAMQLDTSCSSSLLAVHLACQSLRSGDCNLALAGGVNLMLSPIPTIVFCKLKALALDGRCKTFDAAANGYTRGEGCGIVVLKRISDAIADGDNVLAVIRGSAANHDGKSNGLTAPNGSAQEALLKQALIKARVKPNQIQYVEAHGTGTSLGDPIEVLALGKVLGRDRSSDELLHIGSVKTNFGHLEAAAGVASLIKVVLALQHQQIPPSLHFENPNPYIPWDKLPVKIPTELTPWDTTSERFAGVSSFGMSGTNVHVIISDQLSALKDTASHIISHQLTAKSQERSRHILSLSAKTETALQDLVRRYQDYLTTHPELNIADICFTANTGRSHFEHRLAVVTESSEELQQKLETFETEREVFGLVTGQIIKKRTRKIAFLFTGQGSQYLEMGQELYQTQPLFRQTLEKCQEILSPYLEIPLLKIIYPDLVSESALITDNCSLITDYAQPAIFAIEHALATLWKSWGIEPDVVMGHSVGEYVAACIAGVFSLEDALTLVAHRGRLMQQLPASGGMVALMASAEQVENAIAPYAQQVAIAAFNGPTNIVISGEQEALEAICQDLEKQGIKTKALQVSHGFHSHLMEPMLEEFATIAGSITYSKPQIKLISNVTGKRIKEAIATAEYWVNHVRQPVRFADSIQTLSQEGYQIFLEIGAKPILSGMACQCLPENEAVYLPSLRAGQSDWQQMLQSLSQLYIQGVKINWSGFDQDYQRQKLILPNYPWQTQRYWVKNHNSGILPKSSLTIDKSGKFRPLIDKKLQSPLSKETFFDLRLTIQDFPFIADHLVCETVIVPAAFYLSMLLEAAAETMEAQGCLLESLFFPEGLALEEEEVRHVQLVLTAEGKSNSFKMISFEDGINNNTSVTSWLVHSVGQLLSSTNIPTQTLDLEDIKYRCSEPITSQELYEILDTQQVQLGTSFQGIKDIWSGNNEILCQAHLPEVIIDGDDYQFHPALLDCCLQLFGFQLWQILGKKSAANFDQAFVPFSIEKFYFYQRPTNNELWCYARCRLPEDDETQEQNLVGDIELFNEHGQLVAEMIGLEFKQASRQQLLANKKQAIADHFYKGSWRLQSLFGQQLLPENLPSLNVLEQQLAPLASELAQKTELNSYVEFVGQLEELSIDYVLKAFNNLNWNFSLGKQFSEESILKQCQIIPQQEKLFFRLLQMLEEARIISKIDDQWEVTQNPQIIVTEEKISNLLASPAKSKAELTLLKRCGEQLSQVLQGKTDPVQLIFPEGDLTTATELYQESPGAIISNTLVQQTIKIALEKISSYQGVRILEIGGGTGGTTSYLLPHLNPQQTEYTFTDIGTLFTTKAQEKFADYPFVKYQTLDIEKDITKQDFKPYNYDLIVAANVIHATTDLKKTIENVKKLLAPGGILVLIEGTTRQRWLDLIFGLLEGWWKFTDVELRPDYPLLNSAQWENLLANNGFSEVVTIPNQNNLEVPFQQAVIIAQTDSDSPKKASAKTENWLIFADEKGIGAKTAKQLQLQNKNCIVVKPGKEYQQLSKAEFTINPYNPEDFTKLLTNVTAEVSNLHGVVQCWSLVEVESNNLNSHKLEEVSRRVCGTTLSLVQALVKVTSDIVPRLWLVTQGAQPLPENEPEISGFVQASLWGMGKAIALEHPELNCVRIDLDPKVAIAEQAKLLCAEITSEAVEDQVGFRGDSRYVARLVASQSNSQSSFKLKPEHPYLITGGLGGLGLLVARWLVEQGVRYLVLVGRNKPSEAVQSQLQELEQLGAKIVVQQSDVTNLDSLAQVFSEIEQFLPPLKGILHLAGVLEDGILQQLSWTEFTKVMAPKVQGAWNLHTLSNNYSLDFFVLFSSVASLLGSSGQSNHCAANAFLDSLAYYRQSQGLPGLSINWGVISAIGAAASRQADQKVQQQGIGTITPQEVLEALEILLHNPSGQVGVVPIHWPDLLSQRLNTSFLEDWATTSESVTAVESEFLQQLETANPQKRQEMLLDHVRLQVAQVLGLNSSQQIHLQQGFFDLGMDSLTSLELKNRLQNSLGCSIASTVIFDYPTLEELVDYLAQKVLDLEFIAEEVIELAQKEVDTEVSLLDELSQDEIADLLAQELIEMGESDD